LETLGNIILACGAFALVSVASHYISKLFPYIKLPQVTGILIVGILAGPSVFHLLEGGAVQHLTFVGEMALSLIAFAAGAELYLKDLKSRTRSIAWMTIVQLVMTFTLGSFTVFLLIPYIPGLENLDNGWKFAVSVLCGTIMVARSPVSLIAIIREMRARGPFTQTTLGVTMIKDVAIIVIFAIFFSIAKTIVKGIEFDAILFPFVLGQVVAAVLLGIGISQVIGLIMRIPVSRIWKAIFLLLVGYSIFFGTHWMEHWSEDRWDYPIHIEPLLVCIVASFIVANYTRFRKEFVDLVEEAGPPVFVAFFTWTGLGLDLAVLSNVWGIALILFGVRLLALMISSMVAGPLSGEPLKHNKVSWMAYVGQAGVSTGLTAEMQGEFTEWGIALPTILFSMIIFNQIVGPPMHRFSISYVGEDHSRGKVTQTTESRDAVIFGLENQSLALARQLKRHNWNVKIFTRKKYLGEMEAPDLEIIQVPAFTRELVINEHTREADAIVTMISDDDAYEICEWAFESFGTRDLIVRLNEHKNFEKFHQLKCRIVEPSTALVSLLDHFVRSPHAASLLLGLDEGQDTVEFEIRNPDLNGVAIRELRLPGDVIIISVVRGDQHLLTSGYTRLKQGDFVTVVGSEKSVTNVALRFG